jgi:hypothetical protein
MTHEQLIDAIKTAKPDAIWTLHGNTYEGLDWLDGEQTKPTEAELGF